MVSVDIDMNQDQLSPDRAAVEKILAQMQVCPVKFAGEDELCGNCRERLAPPTDAILGMLEEAREQAVEEHVSRVCQMSMGERMAALSKGADHGH
jgi:hypothetical protein